ncbi:MAG: hypothetical protein K9J06_04790 [Flavobacteriales bacterium]|nr:hypothetical protein [Flavobacteriales bacterium]
MKSFFRFAPVAALAAAILSVPACTEDYFDFDRMQDEIFVWNPDLAFPLVFSSLTVEDIIVEDDENQYVTDSDNFITLVKTVTVFSETLNEFLRLTSPQGLGTVVSLNQGEIDQFTGSGQVQKVVSPPYTLSFDNVSGAELQHAVFSSGLMSIHVTSDFQHSGSLLVSMPELRLNGLPFSQSYPISYTGGVFDQTFTADLTGYEMTLNSGGGTHSIPIFYTVLLQNGGGAVPNTGNSVNIDHSFTTLDMAFADGYFGQFDLDVPEGVVQMDLLDNGALYFEDPRLRLVVTNQIGASMRVNVQHLYGQGDAGLLPFDYSQAMGTPFIIAAAPSVGDSSVQSFYFTRTNSNIATLVNGQYNDLFHDFDATVNPAGQSYNFASRNSTVRVTAEAELPFWGKSNHYIFEDTLDNPLAEIGDIKDNIEQGLLRINTLNGFPMDGILKLYLMDSLNNVVDSLLANGEYTIRSGPVNSNGRVTSPANTNNDIPIDTARVNTLFGAKYLIVHADLTSTGNAVENIRIYGDDRLQVRIGLQVKLKASPADLEGL